MWESSVAVSWVCIDHGLNAIGSALLAAYRLCVPQPSPSIM